MDPSFKERERKKKKKQKKRQRKKKNRQQVPPSIILQQKGWSFEGGLSRRKPDPEEHRRVGRGSPPPEVMGLIQIFISGSGLLPD